MTFENELWEMQYPIMQDILFKTRMELYAYTTSVDRVSFLTCAKSEFFRSAVAKFGFEPALYSDKVMYRRENFLGS